VKGSELKGDVYMNSKVKGRVDSISELKKVKWKGERFFRGQGVHYFENKFEDGRTVLCLV
jgi:hypothetical protein